MIGQFDGSELIMAAGGVVERRSSAGCEIVLVCRERYGREWSLPKGKQDPGESLQETARREVHEETGCEVKFTGFAGCTHYYHDDLPKVVLYWKMELMGKCDFKPSGEVLEVEWVSPQKALKRLAHDDEKRLLRQLYKIT